MNCKYRLSKPSYSTYQKVSEKLLQGIPKPKPTIKLISGKCYTGYKSLHKTKQAVKWRLFWRLKKRLHYGIF